MFLHVIQAGRPAVQKVTSKPSDTLGREFEYWRSHRNYDFLTSCPTSARTITTVLRRGYTYFDFTVDEGKGRLNRSRDKKLRQVSQKEGGEKDNSCVAFLLCDPRW